ncbi:hypothetical protein PP182_17355 [Maribacter sp. PR1]|uniref:Type ISP restriction/modification enzyme n=1 Tax=Maribacter cobaltidurans TaxID=1178778 RepID=A0ABU7IY88_9FLAO|nr:MULTISPECIES: type ISP restriction/modification enzyme [Maribacter]MDC6390461.1 hypothetical protein [Maribacter sp. PR1]MEE1977850.1 type ISP restriction/modification enzyme [Maribacter cobaltidurans]
MILSKYLEELHNWYRIIHAHKDWASVWIIKKIEDSLGLKFVVEPLDSAQGDTGNVCMANSPEIRNDYKDTFTPIDLLDYIYAVLHSPGYREKYKEFINIDFPRVPYPTDQNVFWQLVQLGGALRQSHFLESPKLGEYITTYPVTGNNSVERKLTSSSPGFEPNTSTDPEPSRRGKVWINDTQYFDNVPLTAWEFYIGGYQPAQKWLKDRRGRTLDFEDILHYQKIIVALTETHRLMQEINGIDIV